ncbi:MAG: efflux RND transporter periplasmic adaptor subunit [Planctomycetota bacterium]|jgi:RND family efflux transporter MFP subunit
MCQKLSVFLKCSVRFLLLSLLIVISACSKNEQHKQKSDTPVKVSNVVKESELTTVTLTPEAEQRLGIETSMIEYRDIQNTLRLGGEIISQPGHELKITAPMSGTVFGVNSDVLPKSGTQVKNGQPILNLLLLTPEKDLAGAREAVEVKQVQLEVAEAKANRTKQLLHDKATSKKLYLEAQAELAATRASFKAAEARLHLLDGTGLETATEGISTFVLKSPIDGVIQHIYVAPGQTVSASTLLFDISCQDPVWVRVPVYVGDMAKINKQKDAIVQPLGNNSDKNRHKAKPVDGPPISNPNSASSDLFFELSNPDSFFRTGQKVSVLLTQLGSGERMVVPWSAVTYDINGGNWVYLKSSPHIYSRQRVEISSVIDGFAVLVRGLKNGDEVVTAGVAEIFGTEFWRR